MFTIATKDEECSHKKTDKHGDNGLARLEVTKQSLRFICLKPYNAYCIAIILLFGNASA